MAAASTDGPTGVAPSPAALTVAAVARRLGVAPATLRTWDRRYGLGPSAHTTGSHRRYGPADLERLDVMRRLTVQGVAPGEAARVALATPAEPALATVTELPRTGAAAPAGHAAAAPVVPLDRPGQGPRGLARAAMALDPDAATQIVLASVARRGVVATWEELVCPVLESVGRRWARTGAGVEVEHLLSEAVTAAFARVAAGIREPRNARPVLLAGAPDEEHTLPLRALAAALAERGVATRTLGARLPHEALVAAIRRSGPAVVFVWCQLSATADGALLGELPAVRPAPLVLVGGPGWPAVSPPGVRRVGDLSEAVTVVTHAVGA